MLNAGCSMRPIPTAEFSDLIGSIYECALDPVALAGHALARCAVDMAFANASLDCSRCRPARMLLTSSSGMYRGLA